MDIFPDSFDEQTEQFTVVVTSSSDNILPPVDGGPVITITDEEGKEISENHSVQNLRG